MTTYAVLGCTGQTGGSILEILLQSPDNKIRAYVRSKQKLLSMHLGLDKLPNVSIYEAGLDNIDELTKCIAGTQAVFLTAAASENVPGCNVAQQQSACMVEALERLQKQDPHARLPQLIILSSASLEPGLLKDMPGFARAVVKTGFSNIYADLRKAETFLRSYDWIKQVYIKPGGLVHDKQHGHVLSTERTGQSFMSFLDLAAGMVEVADADDDKWNTKNVGVLPASPGTKFEWKVPYFLFKGLLWHFFPGLYPGLSGWLP